jgi:hypothetical protein
VTRSGIYPAGDGGTEYHDCTTRNEPVAEMDVRAGRPVPLPAAVVAASSVSRTSRRREAELFADSFSDSFEHVD